MSNTIRYIAFGVGITAALVIIAVLTVLLVTYFARRRRAQHNCKGARRLHSQYSYISPLDPPLFVIPPYAVDEDAFEESGSGSSMSNIPAEDAAERKDECESPVSQSPMGTPTISHPQFQRSLSEIESKYNRERARPKYRRAASTLTPAHRAIKRKSSVTPYGKIQASIHYVTTKSLLVVQVNGMFDLPQLRTSGVSTPYVRVNLMSGDDDKDVRTNFMNLSTNRICVFDRISLEQAENSTLKFVVLDYDKFSRSEFVADILVPLSEINLEEGETIMRKLKSQSVPEVNDELGTLSVSLCQEPRAGRLVVHVIKAEGLPSHKSEDILGEFEL
ncbi:hypothetical protein QZH41_014892, partial [Actinostola sp. cb2023]